MFQNECTMCKATSCFLGQGFREGLAHYSGVLFGSPYSKLVFWGIQWNRRFEIDPRNPKC